MTPPVYLDYNATTPVAPEVVEAAMRSMVAAYGNPSSSYSLGREAHATVEGARAAVAELIGAAGADEVCFTGSFRIAVQTTSYGALPPEDILQVAQGLMTAAQLAKAMSAEIQLAGYRVIGD